MSLAWICKRTNKQAKIQIERKAQCCLRMAREVPDAINRDPVIVVLVMEMNWLGHLSDNGE